MYTTARGAWLAGKWVAGEGRTVKAVSPGVLLIAMISGTGIWTGVTSEAV